MTPLIFEMLSKYRYSDLRHGDRLLSYRGEVHEYRYSEEYSRGYMVNLSKNTPKSEVLTHILYSSIKPTQFCCGGKSPRHYNCFFPLRYADEDDVFFCTLTGDWSELCKKINKARCEYFDPIIEKRWERCRDNFKEPLPKRRARNR